MADRKRNSGRRHPNGQRPQQQNSKQRSARPAKKEKPFRNIKSPFKGLIPVNEDTMYINRIQQGSINLPFLIIVLVLLVIGIIMMYSASYALALRQGEDATAQFFLNKQLFFAGIGLAALFLLACPFFDYHALQSPIVYIGAYGISLMLMIIVLVGGTEDTTTNGASRWISLGGVRFQPSELMKLALIILIAAMLSKDREKINENKTLFKYIGIIGFTAFITIKQPHLSGAFIMCAISFLMIYISGVKPFPFFAILIGGVAVGLLAAWYMYTSDGYGYIGTRVDSWLHAFESVDEDGTWQTRNSIIAIGSGGMFGLGLGNSRQKFLYLPEAQNDFVFSIVCEELGFVGALIIMIIFLMLVLQGFHIAEKAPDRMGTLLVTGITLHIGLQALMNIAVVTNTIPNTGISLPFFSYGGTALCLQLAEMGIVLNVSRQSMPKNGKEAEKAELARIQKDKDAVNGRKH